MKRSVAKQRVSALATSSFGDLTRSGTDVLSAPLVLRSLSRKEDIAMALWKVYAVIGLCLLACAALSAAQDSESASASGSASGSGGPPPSSHSSHSKSG